MIRLLIWIGVGVALVGFFYKSLDGGGARKDAQQRDSERLVRKGTTASVADGAAALATPATANAALVVPLAPATNVAPSTPAPVVASPAPAPLAPTATVIADRARPIGRGLSFALADAATVPARVAHIACHGAPAPIDRPHRGSCNPYEGDTSCRIILPIACYRSTGAAAPPNLEQDFYKGWTYGQLAATQPVLGALLKSEPDASARCEAEFGAGWRMAEFHDGGGGWGLQGERRSGLHAGTRYWVHINDQRGNCWNSAP